MVVARSFLESRNDSLPACLPVNSSWYSQLCTPLFAVLLLLCIRWNLRTWPSVAASVHMPSVLALVFHRAESPAVPAETQQAFQSSMPVSLVRYSKQGSPLRPSRFPKREKQTENNSGIRVNQRPSQNNARNTALATPLHGTQKLVNDQSRHGPTVLQNDGSMERHRIISLRRRGRLLCSTCGQIHKQIYVHACFMSGRICPPPSVLNSPWG